MSLGSYRPENGYAILADSKHSLRLYGTFRGDFWFWDKLITVILRYAFTPNFAAGRDEWVLPDKKIIPGLYIVVRLGTIFLFRNKIRAQTSPQFRGKFSFWQGTDIIQVLRCTLYAEVLKLYRVTPSRTENRPKFTGCGWFLDTNHAPSACIQQILPTWCHSSRGCSRGRWRGRL